MNDTIAIFGSGFSVFNLKNVRWFDNLKLLYWGDIDVQGFEILSQFRSYFPQTKSILMDKLTFDKFFEDDNGTPTNISTRLHLTDEEQQLYDILKTNNWELWRSAKAVDVKKLTAHLNLKAVASTSCSTCQSQTCHLVLQLQCPPCIAKNMKQKQQRTQWSGVPS
jgi:hypothetical protein